MKLRAARVRPPRARVGPLTSMMALAMWTGCEAPTPTGARATATASAAARAAPKAAPASLGEPCGLKISRPCGAGLTCVAESSDVTACLALPIGGVCGAFQCKPDEACCDADGNTCSPPGAECTPRADPGRRGSLCRGDDGCDPLLRCDQPPKAAFGVCVER